MLPYVAFDVVLSREYSRLIKIVHSFRQSFVSISFFNSSKRYNWFCFLLIQADISTEIVFILFCVRSKSANDSFGRNIQWKSNKQKLRLHSDKFSRGRVIFWFALHRRLHWRSKLEIRLKFLFYGRRSSTSVRIDVRRKKENNIGFSIVTEPINDPKKNVATRNTVTNK